MRAVRNDRGSMTATSEDEFETFLIDIDQPRLDKRWHRHWSVDSIRRATPPLMTLDQMNQVVQRISWVRWTLRAENKTALNARVRLEVDFDEPAHIELERSSVGRRSRLAYIACSIGALSSFFLAAFTPLLSLALLAVLAVVVVAFVVVARHSVVLSGSGITPFGKAMYALRGWMVFSAEELELETVPAVWYQVRDDPEICHQIAEWFLARVEIDELTEHIDEGVTLRKHLSPVDPRRATMQTEIGARRAKRDSLQALRDELADRITAEANAILSERDRHQREQEQRHREAEAEDRKREKFRKTWNAVTEAEQERVKRHEAIDRWFDKDA